MSESFALQNFAHYNHFSAFQNRFLRHRVHPPQKLFRDLGLGAVPKALDLPLGIDQMNLHAPLPERNTALRIVKIRHDAIQSLLS